MNTSRGFRTITDGPKGLIPPAPEFVPGADFTVSAPDGSEFDICGECNHALYKTCVGTQKVHECKCCVKSGRHNDREAIRLVRA